MRNSRLILWVSLTGTVLGCGQKGPLVLPDAQKPHKQIGLSRPPAAKPQPSAPAASTPAAPAGTAAPTPAPPDDIDGSQTKPDAAPQP